MAEVIPAGESSDPTLASIVLDALLDADQGVMASRIAGLLPPSWFGTGATEVNSVSGQPGSPVLNIPIQGAAYNLAWVYVLYQYVLTQSRIATATGVWLDRIAYDFFGYNLLRRTGEQDGPYRIRIYQELFRQRQTRQGVAQALIDLTGVTPKIMELWNPGDCGAYDISTSGYDVAGAYGDLSLNNQFLITAYRSISSGVADLAGYDNPGGGYDVGGALEYIDTSWISGQVTDTDIYNAIAQTVAAGVTAWVAILTEGEVFVSAQFYFGSADNSQNLALGGFFF